MAQRHPTPVARKQLRTVQSAATTLFGAVSDPIRAASRIVQGRNLNPEAIRETCNVGFNRIFRTR